MQYVISKLGGYLLTGGLAAVVDVGAFLLLNAAGVSLAVAAALSFGAAAVTNYLLSSRFVFDHAWSVRGLALFLLVAIIGLIINVGITVIGANVAHFPPPVAKIVGIGTAFLVNFLLNLFVVFRAGSPCQSAVEHPSAVGITNSVKGKELRHTCTSQPITRVVGPYVAAFVVAVILMVPAILNGAALFYEDSPAYVAKGIGPWRAMGLDLKSGRDWLRDGPQKAEVTEADSSKQATNSAETKRYWLAGRSLAYSIVTYSNYAIGGFLLVLLSQSMLAAVPISLVWLRCFSLPVSWLFGVAALLMSVTSLGVFSSLVMPDFAAGIVILISAMILVCRKKLLKGDLIILFCILVYATVLHDSHIALLVALVSVGAVLLLCERRLHSAAADYRGILILIVAGVGAFAYVFGFATLAVLATGEPTLRLPHLTAHFLSRDHAREFLDKECPKRHYRICKYRDQLPMPWTEFLFQTWANEPYEERRKISDEQLRLIGEAFLDRPYQVGTSFVKDALEQQIKFSYFDLDQDRKVRFFAQYMPQKVIDAIDRSVLGQSNSPLEIASVVQQSVVLLALPVLLLLMWRKIPPNLQIDGSSWVPMTGVSVAGVVANGLICGLAAFPYDRFQARVMWVIPFLAFVGMALWYAYCRLPNDQRASSASAQPEKEK